MLEINDDLLAGLEEKWLNGTITPEEMQAYAQWYNQRQQETVEVPEDIALSRSEHYQRMLGEVERMVAATDPSYVSAEEKAHFTARRRKMQYAISAAAVLVLLLATCVLYFTRNSVPQTNNRLADVKPGKPGLVLTLYNGKEIMLDTIPDGLVSEQNGIKVIKENGTIRYDGEGVTGQYNTATTNTGRRFRVQLPDNSIVWLNSGSSLHYPLRFQGGERRVMLTGEAYFEVTHAGSNAPFIVKAGGLEVQVLGTSFNINSYENEPAVTTTLLQGRVVVRSGSAASVLNPDQVAVKAHNDDQIRVGTVKSSNAVGWIHDKFIFDNMQLEEIMRSIERWYGVPVSYEQGVNRAMVFSGATPMNRNLSEVLKVLTLSGIHCSLENDTLIVKP